VRERGGESAAHDAMGGSNDAFTRQTLPKSIMGTNILVVESRSGNCVDTLSTNVTAKSCLYQPLFLELIFLWPLNFSVRYMLLVSARILFLAPKADCTGTKKPFSTYMLKKCGLDHTFFINFDFPIYI
jgi:hypothetical protein